MDKKNLYRSEEEYVFFFYFRVNYPFKKKDFVIDWIDIQYRRQ